MAHPVQVSKYLVLVSLALFILSLFIDAAPGGGGELAKIQLIAFQAAVLFALLVPVLKRRYRDTAGWRVFSACYNLLAVVLTGILFIFIGG